MRHSAIGAACVPMLLACATPVLAHHSYALFDRDKTNTLQGTVAKFEWVNPHIFVWLYVKNAQGKQDLYRIEGASLSMLQRAGWSGDTIKVGEKVTLDYNPLRDGRSGGYFVKMTHADGTISNAQAAHGPATARP